MLGVSLSCRTKRQLIDSAPSLTESGVNSLRHSRMIAHARGLVTVNTLDCHRLYGACPEFCVRGIA
jgi:hypothetical protein